MSQTMQQSLESRRARGFWPRAETTAVELLLPIGAPLGRPAAMARFAAAQRPPALLTPTRRPMLGRLPG